MATTKVILKKEKVDAKGEAPLYIRITKDRKSTFISLGYKIKEKDWNEAQSIVKKSHPNSTWMNNFITTKLAEVQNNALEQEKKSEYIPAIAIKQAVLGHNSVNFLEYAKAFKEKAKPRVSLGTIDNYENVIQKISNFTGKKSLTLNEITPLFIDKFETHLRTVLKNGQNTVHSNFKILRRFINEAIKDDLLPLSQNPFLKRKFTYEKTNIEFLTEEELSKMEAASFPDDSLINHVRNIFVFACYAGGLRVSDILMLIWAKFDGERLLLNTKKTSSTVSIKLPSKALEIINFYKPQIVKPLDLIFPFLQKYDISTPLALKEALRKESGFINQQLTIIAKKAKIEKHIHMHMSRHTFATRALKKGMRIEYVSKLLGHSSINTTQIYATIVNEDLDNAMNLLG